MNIGIPDCCPICHGKLEIKVSSNGIKDLFCVNDNCPSRFNVTISTFLERLNVMGVSNTTLENWNIKTIEDVVNFRADKSYKSELNFQDELEKKMWSSDKENLFVALSAFAYGVGRREMAKFYSKFGGESILDSNWQNNVESNPSVKEGIILESLPKIREMWNLIVNDSRYHGKAEEEEKSIKKVDSSKGSICFTGKLETMTRSVAQEKARKLGYEIAESVAKGLGVLVVADAGLKGAPSSKLKKAMKLGIKIVGETEFNSWIS